MKIINVEVSVENTDINKTSIRKGSLLGITEYSSYMVLYQYAVIIEGRIIVSCECFIPIANIELLKFNKVLGLYQPLTFIWGFFLQKDPALNNISSIIMIEIDRYSKIYKQLNTINNSEAISELGLNIHYYNEYFHGQHYYDCFFSQECQPIIPGLEYISKDFELVNPEDLHNPLYRIKQ